MRDRQASWRPAKPRAQTPSIPQSRAAVLDRRSASEIPARSRNHESARVVRRGQLLSLRQLQHARNLDLRPQQKHPPQPARIESRVASRTPGSVPLLPSMARAAGNSHFRAAAVPVSIGSSSSASTTIASDDSGTPPENSHGVDERSASIDCNSGASVSRSTPSSCARSSARFGTSNATRAAVLLRPGTSRNSRIHRAASSRSSLSFRATTEPRDQSLRIAALQLSLLNNSPTLSKPCQQRLLDWQICPKPTSSSESGTASAPAAHAATKPHSKRLRKHIRALHIAWRTSPPTRQRCGYHAKPQTLAASALRYIRQQAATPTAPVQPANPATQSTGSIASSAMICRHTLCSCAAFNSRRPSVPPTINSLHREFVHCDQLSASGGSQAGSPRARCRASKAARSSRPHAHSAAAIARLDPARREARRGSQKTSSTVIPNLLQNFALADSPCGDESSSSFSVQHAKQQ